jgi:hypothetical protein
MHAHVEEVRYETEIRKERKTKINPFLPPKYPQHSQISVHPSIHPSSPSLSKTRYNMPNVRSIPLFYTFILQGRDALCEQK